MGTTDVAITHTGYVDLQVVGRKADRNFRLLQRDYAERPDDPFVLFNMAAAYLTWSRPELAMPLLQESSQRLEVGDYLWPRLYALIAGCYQQLGQKDEALAACQLAVLIIPRTPS